MLTGALSTHISQTQPLPQTKVKPHLKYDQFVSCHANKNVSYTLHALLDMNQTQAIGYDDNHMLIVMLQNSATIWQLLLQPLF